MSKANDRENFGRHTAEIPAFDIQETGGFPKIPKIPKCQKYQEYQKHHKYQIYRISCCCVVDVGPEIWFENARFLVKIGELKSLMLSSYGRSPRIFIEQILN